MAKKTGRKSSKPSAKKTKTKATAKKVRTSPAKKAAKITRKPKARAAKPKAVKASKPKAQDKGEAKGISSEAIFNATGKTKEEWFAILDQSQADKLAHRDIAKMLSAEHDLGDWWSQMVTVEYELARGLRQPNESSAGGFQVSVSKTINAAIDRIDKAWANDAERAKWLGDYPVEVRVAHPQRGMRLTWLSVGHAEGTHVDVAFTSKDNGSRGMVSVQHRKLSGPEDVSWARSFWSVKLESLRAGLER